jgi:hypothetical protein
MKMALILKSFSQPDQLKRFQPENLIRLLKPYRLFFEMKGFSLPGPDGGEIDWLALAGILAEPDEEMPSDLVEALHLIEHLGTNEYYDDLLQLAGENGIEPAGDATAPDLAAQVWLRNPQALERKYREGLFQQRKSFESFRAAGTEATIGAEDIPADLGPLEEALGRYFEEKKRGVGCRVIRKDSPGEVRFLVQHGQPCKREPSRKGALSTCTFFRPEKTDIVIVDAAHNELRINASCKPDLRKYRELFGLHLFGDAERFVYAEKYTLEPLREHGEAALRCKDVEGIESVWLTQLELDWGGAFEHVERHDSVDVFKDMAVRQAKIPDQPIIRKAVFKVKLEGEKKARTVSVRAGNQAGYQRSEECMLVEQWLWARGFVLFGTKACAKAA